MERIKKHIIPILALLLGFTTACDDFLTKYPHDSVPYDNAFQTQDDFEVALNGVYAGFKSAAYYGKYYTVIPDLLTDEVTSVLGFTNELGLLYRWNYNATDEDIEAIWAQIYFTIARANTIIQSAPNLESNAIDDSTRFEAIVGEALTARALGHFDLLRFFAKPYNPITANADAGIPYMKTFSISNPDRESIESNFDDMEADLLQAIPMLEDAETNSYYLNKAAAEALLARIYLYKQDYNNAISFAQQLVNNNQFKLTTRDNFANMWLNDESDEIIWRVGLTTTDAAGKNPGSLYYNDAQGLPDPNYMPTNNFLDLFASNDIRYTTYFTTEMNTDSLWLTMVNKYPTNPQFTSVSNANGSNMPKVFRLAEQYLILAEAYANLGESSKAWEYIQFLRTNRIRNYNPFTDPVPTNLLDEIFNERKREMAFEGHLYFDYKRLGYDFTRQGKATEGNNLYTNDVNPLTIPANFYKWQWPIPQAEIEANEGISESDQNSGY